jgi:hypothetical protein
MWSVTDQREVSKFWHRLRLKCHICNHSSVAKESSGVGLSINHKLFGDGRACALHVREMNFKRSGLTTEDFIKAISR